ncbi:MAG: 3-hydroxybutyryl-CoA dehydrogenase [Ignavibacteria bacterium RIFOXYB2_FULL_35_12]|nr:MAG: 3-hydroxybutyryl-CoA dehydrogenase [Ignavibacteria bacterium GWA2_36_19]OGU57975.1 MAG: 3-hydroxybutyryl-CoA dehydrogenase [Ignavibacteria bacterium GWF2_35_20]OGU79521.1 MAG: 3-hydroxybutyryl-CoA dehydrogenase [Ignavibacteria bacterium RIFOXYA2_FULL_35_9]OGU90504.1 MAG: 3-hydroxybutyryl-CoA dehydrogenase [Ignavibacteria bacterium RIFOXYC12_FULL_35_11]OGU91925.1 MAG: 3-hydroxybutyryl-CoA dehydrogenase [Ignavibacteria bacterium RIFOXYA12_FULL_35_25]OGU95110.1 MAG: 3-hydroxybutyryl-CoA d
MEFNKIAVVGGGTMGNGIAHVFALKGFHVNLIEMSEELVRKAIKTIEGNLDRQLKKQLIDEKSKSDALARISPIVGLENTPGEVDLVIEAIYENKDAKISLFNKLQNIIKQESIFASNTSSISITELASASRPDKFIGMHFMNPVPMMKLIEIIRGYSTSNSTYNAIKELSLKIDKVPVEVHDYPGFISNRILMPMINEAIYTLMEGVASAEDIDTVMKLGMNHPMGPLTLADFIGLDVCLAIMEVLYNGFNDSKYRPCPLLKKMVTAKKLGRKTGEGFFKYS